MVEAIVEERAPTGVGRMRLMPHNSHWQIAATFALAGIFLSSAIAGAMAQDSSSEAASAWPLVGAAEGTVHLYQISIPEDGWYRATVDFWSTARPQYKDAPLSFTALLPDTDQADLERIFPESTDWDPPNWRTLYSGLAFPDATRHVMVDHSGGAVNQELTPEPSGFLFPQFYADRDVFLTAGDYIWIAAGTERFEYSLDMPGATMDSSTPVGSAISASVFGEGDFESDLTVEATILRESTTVTAGATATHRNEDQSLLIAWRTFYETNIDFQVHDPSGEQIEFQPHHRSFKAIGSIWRELDTLGIHAVTDRAGDWRYIVGSGVGKDVDVGWIWVDLSPLTGEGRSSK